MTPVLCFYYQPRLRLRGSLSPSRARVGLSIHNQMAPKIISLEEVKKHNTAKSLWLVIEGKVYDVTPYSNDHPGGLEIMLQHAGACGCSGCRAVCAHTAPCVAAGLSTFSGPSARHSLLPRDSIFQSRSCAHHRRPPPSPPTTCRQARRNSLVQ